MIDIDLTGRSATETKPVIDVTTTHTPTNVDSVVAGPQGPEGPQGESSLWVDGGTPATTPAEAASTIDGGTA